MSRRDYNHENGICSPAAYENIIESLENENEDLKNEIIELKREINSMDLAIENMQHRDSS
jgi:predicted RNase H-like nuclease (RuvC/YqgF family)